VNRHQRRAAQATSKIRDPKGTLLEPALLDIRERDAQGRPTIVRICWDDERLGDVVVDKNPQMLLCWLPVNAAGFKGN